MSFSNVENFISDVSSYRINYKFIYIYINYIRIIFLRIQPEQRTMRDNSNFTKTET